MDPRLPRALALVFGAFGPEARGRLLAAFPPRFREAVLSELEAESDDRADLTVVEQILLQDLNRLFNEEDEGEAGLEEVLPLRVSDLLAVVFLHTTPQTAAGILAHLPFDLQTDVLRKLCAQSWEAFERHVGRDEATFVATLDEALGQPARRDDPAFAAGTAGALTSAQHVRRLLTAIHRADPGVANQIRSRIYSLDDLDRLTDGELQVLLTGIDDWDLATAMSRFPRRLHGRVLSNVSERRAQLLAEDERFLSDTEEEKVVSVQLLILERARTLFEVGRINTYLGSIGVGDADTVDADTQSERSDDWSQSEPEVVEPALSRLKPILAGAAAVVAASALLVWWTSEPLRRTGSSGGASASVEDYARRSVRAGLGGSSKASGGKAQQGRSTEGELNGTRGPIYLLVEGRRVLLEGKTLSAGDEVATGDDGEAVIVLGDAMAKAQMDASTTVRLGSGDPGDPILRIRVGRVWVQVDDPRLVVSSPVLSVSGSQGTVFEMSVVLSGATTVRVLSGTAWVNADVADTPEQIVMDAGRLARVGPRGDVDVGSASESVSPTWLGLF